MKKPSGIEHRNNKTRAYSDIFTGIRHFEHTFLLKVKADSTPYQVPPRHVTYAL